jgi:antitoxin Phd
MEAGSSAAPARSTTCSDRSLNRPLIVEHPRPLLARRTISEQSHAEGSCHIRLKNMRKIQLKDAKAKLSTVVDKAVRGKPSIITRHGRREVVVLSYADWERLSRVPSFGRLLMAAPLENGPAPPSPPTPKMSRHLTTPVKRRSQSHGDLCGFLIPERLPKDPLS